KLVLRERGPRAEKRGDRHDGKATVHHDEPPKNLVVFVRGWPPCRGAGVDEGVLESVRQARGDPVRARRTSQTGTWNGAGLLVRPRWRGVPPSGGRRGLTLAPRGAIVGPTLTGGNSWPK